MRTFISRMIDVVLRRQRENRLSQEVQAHLDLLTDEYIGRGMSPEDARLAARKAFGGVDQIKMTYRDRRGLPGVDSLLQDARFGVRLLARDRGFAATAILVLALGIGINNLFFTLVYAHKFRGLAIERPDRVLFISTFDDRVADRLMSPPDLDDLRAAQRSFQGVAAYVNAVATVGDEGRAPDRFDAAYVSANAFDVIGVRPLAGRGPDPTEDTPGMAPVVILGTSAWQSRYGGDPSIVGRSILVNGSPATVVGIMPERSGFPSTAGVWLPLGQLPGLANQTRDARNLRVFGRLRHESTESDARAEVEAIMGRLETGHPDTNRNLRARVVPINRRLLGNLDGWVPFIVAGLIVIFVACANVANLMIARALRRATEMAIRTSLGASRGRLVRQLLIEGTVLAALGGAAGLALSLGGVRLFQSAIPDNLLPYWIDYSLDTGVFAGLVGASLIAVLASTLVPALQASKTDVNRTLKDGSRTLNGGGTQVWSASFLTVELALALVLLGQLGLTTAMTNRDLPTDAALRTTAVVTAAITLPANQYASGERHAEFFRRLDERLRPQAGVIATGVATFAPISGASGRRLDLEGRGLAPGETAPTVSVVDISPGYFSTLGFTTIRGRAFTDIDGQPGYATAIVNERFAEMFMTGEDPLGRRLALTAPSASADALRPWVTVVGVSPSIRQSPTARAAPVVYLPLQASTPATVVLMVRSAVEPSAATRLLREAVLAVDPNIALYRMQTLAASVEDSEWSSRVSNALALTVTLLSVLLATIGLYAVTAHGVGLRTREIGIRMALGARAVQVVRVILRSVRIPLTLGLVLGLAGALAWDRAFSGQAAEYAAGPGKLLAVTVLMIALVVAACFVPVRRATRMSPVAALRHE